MALCTVTARRATLPMPSSPQVTSRRSPTAAAAACCGGRATHGPCAATRGRGDGAESKGCSSPTTSLLSSWSRTSAVLSRRSAASAHARSSVRMLSSGASEIKTHPANLVKSDSETAEETVERRNLESLRVEERMEYVETREQFSRILAEAGEEKLVVLEVESDTECEMSYPVPEVQWKQDPEEIMEPCVNLKHSIMRCVRNCEDVHFVYLQGDMTKETMSLCKELGVNKFPTIQFYKKGTMLWEHAGADNAGADLDDGLLYFGDSDADGGDQASKFITEVKSKEDLDEFITNSGDRLAVVDVSTTTASSCVRIFPAVLALAKNMSGACVFARLLIDACKDGDELTQSLDVTQVPTFLFYLDGKLVGRHVGSSRGDLVGKILQVLGALGVKPPPPPARRSSAVRL